MVIEYVFKIYFGPAGQLSVSLMSMDGYVPAVVGVPEITPDALRLNPGGKGELCASRLKVTAPCPPVACSCALYACPTVPADKLCGEMLPSAVHDCIVIENV
jgi:hypothetical protein